MRSRLLGPAIPFTFPPLQETWITLSFSGGNLDLSGKLLPPSLALSGFNLDSDHGIEAGAQEGSLTQPSSHWILLDLL